MSQQRLLIIDDDAAIRWVLERAVSRMEVETLSLETTENALETIAREQVSAVISDIRMPGQDGLSMLEALNETYPDLPVIIMTAHSDLDTAVAAFKGGAFEYLPKPFDIEEALAVIQRALAQAKQHDNGPESREAEQSLGSDKDIIGDSPAMQNLFRAIGRLSGSEATVLINGESGTGKELVAKALHRHSKRSKQPFIALNMAAIPRELVEAELFGHEKGAFTGATAQRKGRFEQADGGTLFLDEIGDMPLETQTRLLRVLADGEFYRVGGHTPLKVNVRVIAATHQDLSAKVKQGDFREDLFHRLNVIRLHLPRLAERAQDIPLLAEHFLNRSAEELGVSVKTLKSDALKFLMQLNWPGNVRQLENVCRWLTVMASGNEVHKADLPDDLAVDAPSDLPTFEPAAGSTVAGGTQWQLLLTQYIKEGLARGSEDLLQSLQPELEQLLLEAALSHTGGHKQNAAKLLGWGRNTLTRKLKAED